MTLRRTKKSVSSRRRSSSGEHALFEFTGGVAQLGAEMSLFNEGIFTTEDVINFVCAAFAEHRTIMIEECFGQFLFATGAWLHLLHLGQGITS
jgi:hypothetical protein